MPHEGAAAGPHRGGTERLVQDLVQDVDGVVEDDWSQGGVGVRVSQGLGVGRRAAGAATHPHVPRASHALDHASWGQARGDGREAQQYQYFGIQRSRRKPSKSAPVLTASHSFMSSPGGSRTASSTAPVPSVCSMCCLSVRPLAPTGTFFTERKVPPFLQRRRSRGSGLACSSGVNSTCATPTDCLLCSAFADE